VWTQGEAIASGNTVTVDRKEYLSETLMESRGSAHPNGDCFRFVGVMEVYYTPLGEHDGCQVPGLRMESVVLVRQE